MDGKFQFVCALGSPESTENPSEPAQPVRSCPLFQEDEATMELKALAGAPQKKAGLKLVAHCSGNAAQVLEKVQLTLGEFLSSTQGRYYALPIAANKLPKFMLKRMDAKGLPPMRVWMEWLESETEIVPEHKPDSMYAWLAKMDYRKRTWRWEGAEVVHGGRISIQIRLLQHGKTIPATLRLLLLCCGATEVGFA
jgi:hypothetical protein